MFNSWQELCCKSVLQFDESTSWLPLNTHWERHTAASCIFPTSSVPLPVPSAWTCSALTRLYSSLIFRKSTTRLFKTFSCLNLLNFFMLDHYVHLKHELMKNFQLYHFGCIWNHSLLPIRCTTQWILHFVLLSKCLVGNIKPCSFLSFTMLESLCGDQGAEWVADFRHSLVFILCCHTATFILSLCQFIIINLKNVKF